MEKGVVEEAGEIVSDFKAEAWVSIAKKIQERNGKDAQKTYARFVTEKIIERMEKEKKRIGTRFRGNGNMNEFYMKRLILVVILMIFAGCKMESAQPIVNAVVKNEDNLKAFATDMKDSSKPVIDTIKTSTGQLLIKAKEALTKD